jgi:squalene-associated FAD-dependent desaturase
VSARVVVVGGGLAGIAAALEAADHGAEVTLLERRAHLGGLTWSFERKGLVFDNGQHVFMHCCTAYRAFLHRIGAAEEVQLQARLDVPVLEPGRRASRIARSGAPLPAPAHLAPSLLTYRHLPLGDRLRVGRAVAALRSLRLDDPSLDTQTFGAWLARHGQSAAAIERLWDLVILPTVNLGAAEASLALAARVFRTGLLDTADGGEIGWATVPLGRLHGENGRRALEQAGVDVRLGTAVRTVVRRDDLEVDAADRTIHADAVVVALSHEAAPSVLPPGALGDVSGLGRSPIVNVHLVLDRKVTDIPFAAALSSPIQFVFDRTGQSGIPAGDPRQCLVVSLSAATAWAGVRPDDLVRTMFEGLGALFAPAGAAQLLDGVVTREHAATFRGVPGTAAMRPGPRSAIEGVFVAGAWTDTGWPATMEGAVRSGVLAARAAAGSADAASWRAPDEDDEDDDADASLTLEEASA